MRSPYALRHEAFDAIHSWFLRFFETHAQYQSALLCVAQYWDDNADDAVHAFIMASTQAIPTVFFEVNAQYKNQPNIIYPWKVREVVGEFPWEENLGSIRPFQAFCVEGSAQYNYFPLPVFAFFRDGRADCVGEVVRPWLDLPQAGPTSWQRNEAPPFEKTDVTSSPQSRSAEDEAHWNAYVMAENRPLAAQIWADALVARNEPQGLFMSLCLAANLTAEMRHEKDSLLVTHGETWLRELSAVMPLSTARWRHGLLSGGAVHFEQETSWMSMLPQFEIFDSLHLSPTGNLADMGLMRSLKRLTGVRHVSQVAQLPAPERLEHLGLLLTESVQLAPSLNMLSLNLKSLCLGIAAGLAGSTIDDFWTALPPCKNLTLAFVPHIGAEEYQALALPNLDTFWKQPVEALSVSGASPAGLSAGPCVTWRASAATHAELTYHSLATLQSWDFEAQLWPHLPSSVKAIRLVRSACYAPDEVDRARVERASGKTVQLD
jgi:hypothetical protein